MKKKPKARNEQLKKIANIDLNISILQSDVCNIFHFDPAKMTNAKGRIIFRL